MKRSVCLVLVLMFTSAQSYNLLQLATYYGATTLVKLAVKTGLDKTLSGPGQYTIFVPTNSAFATLPESVLNDTSLLTDVLKYHVIPGRTYCASILNELLAPSLLTNDGKVVDVRFNVYSGIVTTEGSPIVFRDQNASNGVLHLIDRVMYPLPLKNIPSEITARSQNFSTLLTAVAKADLGSILARGPFTLFAPTNEAFAKLPAPVLSGLLANLTLLTDVLTYHVLSGTVFSVGLSNGDMPQTIEGKTLVVHIDENGVRINSATLIESDLAVTNGVIHVIDTVLLPPVITGNIY